MRHIPPLVRSSLSFSFENPYVVRLSRASRAPSPFDQHARPPYSVRPSLSSITSPTTSPFGSIRLTEREALVSSTELFLLLFSLAVRNSSLSMISLKDIVPAATNTVNTQFILLEKGSISQDGKETTCLALAADETASLHAQLWGDECHYFEPGDIICLTNGIFSYHKNNLVLRAGKKGKAEKVGEFNMLFVETPNMSEIKWANDPTNPRKFVQEAVISPHSRIFPPLP